MGLFKKLTGFQNSFSKNFTKDLFKDPTRLLTGIDPLSTKLWNGVTGSDKKSLVNVFGSPGEQYYQQAEADGIDVGPSRTLHGIADVVAGFYAGQGLGNLAGAAGNAMGMGNGAGAVGSAGAGGSAGAASGTLGSTVGMTAGGIPQIVVTGAAGGGAAGALGGGLGGLAGAAGNLGGTSSAGNTTGPDDGIPQVHVTGTRPPATTGSTGVGAGVGSTLGGTAADWENFPNNNSNTNNQNKTGKSVLDGIDWGNLIQQGLGLASGNVDRINANKDTEWWNSQLNTLMNMYKPGTPEALLMEQKMAAQDAATGRRSQYGQRAVNLASNLADKRAGIMTSAGYQNMANAYRNRSSSDLNGLFAAMGNSSSGSNGTANANNINALIQGLGALFGNSGGSGGGGSGSGGSALGSGLGALIGKLWGGSGS